MKKKSVVFIVLYIIIIIATVPPAVWCKNQVAICFNEELVRYNFNNLIDIVKVLFSDIKLLFISNIISLIFVLFVSNIYFTIKYAKIENKGIKFKTEDGTFGTANWMNKEELEESFELGTENGLIVGKTDNQIITLPNETRHNKNVAVFGASGSRKSRRICNTKYNKFSKSR